MGQLIDELSPEVVEILKENFESDIKIIEKLIIESGLFYDDLKNAHTEYKGNFRSKRYMKGEYVGIISISWVNKWSDFTVLMFKKIEDFEWPLSYYPLYLREGKHYDHIESCTFENFLKSKNLNQLLLSNDEIKFVYKIHEKVNEIVSSIHESILISQNKLERKKISILKKLDRDENGLVDLVDGESFNRLLNKNQKDIIEIDKNYIQKFVKISIYLKTKKNNTQKIFESINDTKNDRELNELVNLLKNQIHTYELLVFHSISMITSLVESDLITFYEIYECFDQLGVFNSNWEYEVSNKLSNIGDGIKDLMYSIYEMENKIVDSIENLTYTTQDSFNDLQMSISRDLNDIDSSIQVNNLLTGIQTYQMYKINKNTKGLN